jgi:hypothetical protein
MGRPEKKPRKIIQVALDKKPVVDRSGPNKVWGTLRRVAATLEKDHGISINELSCLDCSEWKTCEFAFDGYNTNGDCLAEK